MENIANLTSQQHELNQRYIAGEMERSEYQAGIAAIHKAMSEATNSGPCHCPGCVEHRHA